MIGLAPESRCRIGSVLLLLCPLIGCRGGDKTPLPPLGEVSGTVTFDGRPRENVSVSFAPKKGLGSNGLTDSNGRYELHYNARTKGAVLGKHIVRFGQFDPAEGLDTPPPAKPNNAGKLKPIPEKYSTSGDLTADVQPGKNTFDFQLKSD